MAQKARPPRPHSTWHQEVLFPPQVVRVDFTWFADTEMQRMQFGWTVSHGVEEQTMAMEVMSWVDLTSPLTPFSEAALDVMWREVRALPPFP